LNKDEKILYSDIRRSYTKSGRYTNDSARIDDKVVIVTGSNCGLGKFTAVELAKRGGKIYLACRNEEKAMTAMNEIKSISGNDNIHFLKLDLASLASVREFSKKFHQLETRLDVLVNNGGLLSPKARTQDGFEMNMGVNHLGHFLLTNLLLDLLKKSTPSRVVVVGSDLHRIASIRKQDFNCDKSFPGTWMGYSNSKLANMIFARELSKKLEGTGVTVNSCCPGPVASDVNRNLNLFMR
jgi:retinol dehydrogenase 12